MQIYGLAQSAEKFAKPWLRPKTPIKGLYLTGQDVACDGIIGAAASAFATASCIDWRVLVQNAGVLAVAVKQQL